MPRNHVTQEKRIDALFYMKDNVSTINQCQSWKALADHLAEIVGCEVSEHNARTLVAESERRGVSFNLPFLKENQKRQTGKKLASLLNVNVQLQETNLETTSLLRNEIHELGSSVDALRAAIETLVTTSVTIPEKSVEQHPESSEVNGQPTNGLFSEVS